MTIALCTRCGAKKFGAFSPCQECGFTPTSSEERAKSVLLSDHHHAHTELDKLSDMIKAGKAVEFDPDSVLEYASTMELLDSDPEAMQCKRCGEDLDSLDEALCENCKRIAD